MVYLASLFYKNIQVIIFVSFPDIGSDLCNFATLLI